MTNFWYLLLFLFLGVAFWGALNYFAKRKEADFSLTSLLVTYIGIFVLFGVAAYFIEEKAVLGLLFFLSPNMGSRIFNFFSKKQ